MSQKLTYHQLLYMRLFSFINRVTNPDNEKYCHYGAKGIKVYKNWQNNSEKFIKYCQILPGYGNPNLILARIDHNKGYKPGNLRFTTWSESLKNRRPYSNTGKKHIHWKKSENRYVVQKTINGQTVNFGRFKTLKEAVACKKQNNL